ncbi:MAG: 30S ribosomal protein S14 [Candidatus Pacebacteria bacterium]|nr:30S ribosomal protein S14 [Candidatus Paceibacterota bacterium]
MAKKSSIARDRKREKMVAKYAKKRAELKAKGDYAALQELPLNSSPSRLKNRCFVSGRSRGYMRDFGMNRIEFRKLANEGKIPGVKKASW